MTDRRVVIDTNVWVSGLIYPDSTPGRACKEAMTHSTLVFTEATFGELCGVLQRRKFHKLFTVEEYGRLVGSIQALADIVAVTRPIKACRDPADDKFLDAAVHGDAGHLITGDADLLMLNPFMNIAILTPGDFLSRNG